MSHEENCPTLSLGVGVPRDRIPGEGHTARVGLFEQMAGEPAANPTNLAALADPSPMANAITGEGP